MFDCFNHKCKKNIKCEAQEYATVFSTAMLFLAHEKNLKPWAEFIDEIKYNNRFFPKSDFILNVFESVYKTDRVIYILENEKTELYRARIITEKELPEESRVVVALEEKFPEIFGCLGLDSSEFVKLVKKYSDDPGKYNKDGFWGFNEMDSDAPPSDKAKSGRINSPGISYLYAAEDELTAVVEVKPIIGQWVSVAKIKLKEKLRLFDFCAISSAYNEETRYLLKIIARYFSMPNYEDDIGYLPTQYIANMLKEEPFNFDGIRFPSSLHDGGINIVLFEANDTNGAKPYTPKNYCIESTSLHTVKDITITKETILPLKEQK